MSMQEFEQEEQGQAPGQSEYRAGYMGSYETEQQKIHPYGEQRQNSALHIVAIILSSIGFSFSIVGIVGSAIVLHFARNATGLGDYSKLIGDYSQLIAGGVLGLVSSIMATLVFLAIFVVAIVLLARRVALRRGIGRASLRRRSLGNLGI